MGRFKGVNMKKNWVTDPDISVNKKKLEQIFDITESEYTLPEQIKEVRESLDQSQESIDPDSILHQNIDRANRILDLLEQDLKQGLKSTRLEAAASLINGITSAANSIVGVSHGDSQIEIKQKQLELKERELMIKQALGEKSGKGSGNVINAIVTDRESLLEMIRESKGNPGKKILSQTDK